jgi:hypothetical protein
MLQLQASLEAVGSETPSDHNGGPVTYFDDSAGVTGAFIVQWNNMKA